MAEGQETEHRAAGGGERRIQTVCLLLLTVMAGGVCLYFLRSVLVPFVLALFIALALGPVIDFVRIRARAPRWLAVVLTLLAAAGLLVLVGILVSSSVSEMGSQSEAYQRKFQELLDKVARRVPLEDLRPKLEEASGTIVRTVAGLVGGILNEALAVLSNGLLVLIFVVFLLLGESDAEASPGGIWPQVRARVRQYVAAKVLVSLGTGVLTWVILAVLGVDLALVFGVLAFLLNFIPNIGSVVAVFLPLPVALLGPGATTTTAVLAILLPGAVQFVLGSLWEPRLMGKSLDLNPVAILLALIFWGVIWGIPGMFLATPIAAVLRILLDQADLTRPLAGLLAEKRPPPGPGGA